MALVLGVRDQGARPVLGGIHLEHLRHDHVRRFIAQLEAEGRGAPTIRRIVGVLSSALADAVKRRRLTHNPAQHAPLPPEDRPERNPWSAAQAVTFLDHVRGDRLGELYEVLIGCGLRRGEALALRWIDIDLNRRTLVVRRTLSDVNGHLIFTTPKTKGSAAGVGLSSRVVAALERQRARQDAEHSEWGEAYEDGGLVFARESGAAIRPEYVTARFLVLSREAGLPRVRLHDLRHLAATLMLAAGVPLALVSKTLRHAKVGITADLYSHLSPETATAAADALGAALDAAAAERAAEALAHDATTTRPHAASGARPEGEPSTISAGEGAESSPH